MTARTLLYLPMRPHDHLDRYAKACLEYAGHHHLRLVTTASRADAVLDAAAAGLVDVVLAACRWRGSGLDEIEPVLLGLGVRLAVVRDQHRERVRISTDPTAAKLLALGLTPEQVADALGVPEVQVAAVANRAGPRQQPADHPWRRRPSSAPNVVHLDARRARRAG